jgi:hypothetical protein
MGGMQAYGPVHEGSIRDGMKIGGRFLPGAGEACLPKVTPLYLYLNK